MFNKGEELVIVPADDDDPVAIRMKGQRVTVFKRVPHTGYIVVDCAQVRLMFRPQDLQRIEDVQK